MQNMDIGCEHIVLDKNLTCNVSSVSIFHVSVIARCRGPFDVEIYFKAASGPRANSLIHPLAKSDLSPFAYL
jgi:hypothetical protein